MPSHLSHAWLCFLLSAASADRKVLLFHHAGGDALTETTARPLPLPLCFPPLSHPSHLPIYPNLTFPAAYPPPTRRLPAAGLELHQWHLPQRG